MQSTDSGTSVRYIPPVASVIYQLYVRPIVQPHIVLVDWPEPVILVELHRPSKGHIVSVRWVIATPSRRDSLPSIWQARRPDPTNAGYEALLHRTQRWRLAHP